MLYIDLSIVITLIVIVVTDYKRHLIYDRYLILLIGLATVKNYTLYGDIVPIVTRGIGAALILFISLLIGYGYFTLKKGTDMAGGGDYKLVAVFAFLFELKILLLCLVMEFLYEFIYRYVLFPERSKAPLPFGTSLGACGILVLLGGYL